MKIVTVATHSERYFPLLQQSCKRFGIELVVLGWSTEWKGFTYKYDLMRGFLKTCPPDDIICFVDAYDVVVLQPGDIIEQRFIDTGAKILVAEDMNVKIYYELTARVGFGMCKGKRLNSGTYIGRAAELVQMFDSMCADYDDCKQHAFDDQVMITRYCHKKGADTIQVDIEKQVFIAISSEKNSVLNLEEARMEIRDGKLWYMGMSDPCIIHVPFNTRIEHILIMLGFDVSVVDDNEFKGARVSALVNAILIAIILSVIVMYVSLRL